MWSVIEVKTNDVTYMLPDSLLPIIAAIKGASMDLESAHKRDMGVKLIISARGKSTKTELSLYY